jgi:hypothetical protein
MLSWNDTETLKRIMQELAKLTLANTELTLANNELTLANTQLQADNTRLTQKSSKQAKHIVDLMHQKTAMLRNLEDLQEAKASNAEAEQQKLRATVEVFQPVCDKLKTLAEKATPTSVHIEKLGFLNPSMRGTYILAPNLTYFLDPKLTVSGTPVYKQYVSESTEEAYTQIHPLFIVKNIFGLWCVCKTLNSSSCIAYDPEPKELPLNCNWHEWDEKNKEFVCIQKPHTEKLARSS